MTDIHAHSENPSDQDIWNAISAVRWDGIVELAVERVVTYMYPFFSDEQYVRDRVKQLLTGKGKDNG